ncbi:hypothetical protein BDQ17DRAFT_1331147 [Cyathus striatus]|nr:hypothetical protein BDQ17DRAFT_1331147 [Cyathus striatus]
MLAEQTIMNQIFIDMPDPKIMYSFEGKYGMQLIASMVSEFQSIYGSAMTMVLQYFKHHSNGDTYIVKGMVILLAYQVYEYFIFKFGKEQLFDEITGSAMGKYMGIYLTAFVAQLFYATRIWSLTGHFAKHYRLLAYPVVLLSILQIASGIAMPTVNFDRGQAKTFPNLVMLYSIAFKMIVIQGVSAAACLSETRSRTHSLLRKFIVYAINRAAATSVCALLTIFLEWGLVSFPIRKILLCNSFSMIPLLVNTHLVSVLTARGSLQEEDHSFRLTDVVRLPSVEYNTANVIHAGYCDTNLKDV